MLHGEDIKGGGAGSLNGMANCISNMVGMTRQIPDYLVAGHFHSSGEWTSNLGKIFVNGSFMGPDLYALKNLQRTSPPEQKIMGIHSEFGVTWRYDINLDKGRRH